MNIVVLLKQTPDSTTQIRIGADGRSIETGDVKYIVNPYDEYAIEEALQIREELGGSVTVLGLGPQRITSALRTALAMGADAAAHVVAEDEDLDSFAVADALAQALGTLSFDLVIMGKQAIDDYNEQIGPRLSALLGIPCVTYAAKVAVDGAGLTAHREVEGGTEVVECPLPAILTVEKGINEPRYAALKGIMMAKKKTIDEIAVNLQAGGLKTKALTPPPERPPGKIVGDGVAAVPELIRLLKEEAKVI